ncbi:MAG: guanylate kinase [Rhodobacteraceae bacterium]|nr:guanylate kinase [Paracoccaceae bacterium]
MLKGGRRGLLIILSSPSGVGKTTLARRLIEWDSSISFSISATTRKPRNGEKDGREYYFKSASEFNDMVKAGLFLEHAKVFGNLYGSPKNPVETAIRNSRDIVFDIDWQGGQQIRNSVYSADTVSIFVLPPSIAELRRRLLARGLDCQNTVEGRMQKSKGEIVHWPEYDYVLINSDVDQVLEKIKFIVRAERLRRSRQLGLFDFVEGLNREFDGATQ